MSSELAAYSVSTLSDALDRLGLVGQVEGVHPVGSSVSLCGPAFTVRMAPVGESPASVGDYIDDVAADSIVVIDNAGRTDTTVWGGILTFTAHKTGVGGTVINGVCRDIEETEHTEYPLFARGVHMRTGKDRVQAEAYNVTVDLGGVRVVPGDWLVGDRDGVVVVPADAVERVLELAARIEAAEVAIRDAVAAGSRLDDARTTHGYHQLQTRERA